MQTMACLLPPVQSDNRNPLAYAIRFAARLGFLDTVPSCLLSMYRLQDRGLPSSFPSKAWKLRIISKLLVWRDRGTS